MRHRFSPFRNRVFWKRPWQPFGDHLNFAIVGISWYLLFILVSIYIYIFICTHSIAVHPPITSLWFVLFSDTLTVAVKSLLDHPWSALAPGAFSSAGSSTQLLPGGKQKCTIYDSWVGLRTFLKTIHSGRCASQQVTIGPWWSSDVIHPMVEIEKKEHIFVPRDWWTIPSF